MSAHSESGRIHILPESLINKIAAGEVVERPASVVKELVENSIDADADQILVTLKNGGKDLISVLDNGSGMTETDARYALERHATSKIAKEEDLTQIQTLGFRGEALAAIVGVSRFELHTCRDEKKGATHLKLLGGVLEHHGKTGFPKGTKISVEQLFFNTPARLKFLKSTSTELHHIQQQFTRLALGNPAIRFRLSHNQQMLLNFSTAANFEDRIQQLCGEEFRDGLMKAVHSEKYISFHGLISLPSKTRNSRRWQHLYVNGRQVKCQAIAHGIYDGYRGMLAKGQHPAFFLMIEVNPSEIDVNVHPAKTEIRFRNSKLIHTILADQLSRQIQEVTGRHFFGAEMQSDIPGPPNQIEMELPEQLQLESDVASQKTMSSMDVRQKNFLELSKLAGAPVLDSTRFALSPDKKNEEHKSRNPSHSGIPSTAHWQAKPAPVDAGLCLLKPLPKKPKNFIILGQLHQSLILMEHTHGLGIARQHQVHRELIHHMLTQAVEKDSVERRECEEPLLVQMSIKDSVFLDQHLKLIERCGFGMESFGGNTFSIRSVPFVLPKKKSEKVLHDFVSQVSESGKGAHPDKVLRDLLKIISSHAAVDQNKNLHHEELNLLIAQMEELDLPARTSEGERIWYLLHSEELNKLLKS